MDAFNVRDATNHSVNGLEVPSLGADYRQLACWRCVPEVAFSQGYGTNFQHEAKQYWSFGVRVTDGEGNMLYRGSAPVDKSTVSLSDSTLNLVIFPQLFQLTKDCNLRFDLLPPESSADMQFDSVCIEVCDKVKCLAPGRREA